MNAETRKTAGMMKRTLGVLGVCGFLLLPVYGWGRDGDDNWRRLSPKDKENVRRNYQRWQNLPQQDKEHLRQEWDRFKSLPPDQRDQLRRRYNEQRQR